MRLWQVEGALLLCLVGAGSAKGGAAGGTEAEYAGSEVCKRCHIDQYRSWSRTPMAKAFELLRPGIRPEAKVRAGLSAEKDYTGDPGCLACHATGYGQPGGFRSPEETPDLAGVGCEACHGPGGGAGYLSVMTLQNKKHVLEEMTSRGLVYPVPEGARCTAMCHNEGSPHNAALDSSYAFRWDERYGSGGGHEHWRLLHDHGALPQSYFQTQHPERLQEAADER